MNGRAGERVFQFLCWLSAAALIGAVLMILGYLVLKGAGSLTPELLFGDTDPLKALTGRAQVFDGILPAMAGTVALVVLSVGFALPVGIAAGIYFAVYAPPRVKGVLALLVDILASVPSIVIGLFGLALVIFLHKHLSPAIQPSLLISSIALACLVLPYIIRTTEVSIDSIEPELKLAGQAFGASKLQNTFYILIPRALSGIISGSILAIGRAAEDTAVIMLTGVVASVGMPGALTGKYEAVPFFIYYISAQYANQRELAQGYGAALVLLMICLGLFGLAFLIKRRLESRFFYRG
ncbi:ABC transporter permease subunit [bacterium]|nr:ABC transporter permease subunit [bacterium]